MHRIPLHKKTKRGCAYCADAERSKNGQGYCYTCKHDECPYRVLDKYDSYEEFMASEDARILVTEFFQTAASCYDLMNGNVVARKYFAKRESDQSI